MTFNRDGSLTMMCEACNNITVLKGIKIPNYEKQWIHIEAYVSLDMCPHCKMLTGGSVVQVDEDIAESIALLNRKGYRTYASCSGHSESDPMFYVLFDNGSIMKVDPPEHFHYEFFHTDSCAGIYVNPEWAFASFESGQDDSSDYSEYRNIILLTNEEYQKRYAVMLDNFRKWVEELPSLTNKTETIKTTVIDLNEISSDE